MSVPSTVNAKKWSETIKSLQRKAFWVLGLLLVGFTAYFYYSGLNRPVAGVLWFIGGFLILYYYWVKWFVINRSVDPDFNPGDVGACPDYLSVVPNNSGLYRPRTPTQYFCVDYIGVSRNGGLKKINPSEIAAKINDPMYAFSIDPIIDFRGSGRAAFLQRLTRAGLSYSSAGDASLPTQERNANGAPTYGNSGR